MGAIQIRQSDMAKIKSSHLALTGNPLLPDKEGIRMPT